MKIILRKRTYDEVVKPLAILTPGSQVRLLVEFSQCDSYQSSCERFAALPIILINNILSSQGDNVLSYKETL